MNKWEVTTIHNVEVGDTLDLFGDIFADPNRDNLVFEVEYADVLGYRIESNGTKCLELSVGYKSDEKSEAEPPTCIWFPPNHYVRRIVN